MQCPINPKIVMVIKLFEFVVTSTGSDNQRANMSVSLCYDEALIAKSLWRLYTTSIAGISGII